MNLNNGIDPIKLVVAAFLAQHLNSVTGKLRSGAYELAMAEFPNIARSTLERYWAEYKRTGGAGMAVNNLKGRCGRKTKLTAVLREIYRIKPLLTRAQEIARIEFILDMRDMSHGNHPTRWGTTPYRER